MPVTTWTHKTTWRGCDVEYDCEVEYAIHGKYRRATRLDPEENPEVEILSVTVEATGEDITSEVDENAGLIEECELHAHQEAREAAYEAAERKGDEARERRLFGKDW